MKKYEKLLLDVDGTLLNFDVAERAGLTYIFQQFQQDIAEKLIARYREINSTLWASYERGEIVKSQIAGTRFRRLFEEFSIEADGGEAETEYRKQLAMGTVLMEGAMEVCRYLSGKYELYVVTNGYTETQLSRLRGAGLDQYFRDIFISESIGSQKPKRAFFDHCFSRMETPDPARMLIIGDSLSSDIRGGREAGMDTCWFNEGGRKQRAGGKIDYEIHHLKELMDFL